MNIALCGGMGSGKSTAAKALVAEFRMSRVSLATPVYQLAATAGLPDRLMEAGQLLWKLLPDQRLWPGAVGEYVALAEKHQEQLDRWRAAGEQQVEKPREFMQEMATGIVRRLRPNAFVDYMTSCLALDGLVCDDMRFVNEAQAFREAGWKLVKCACPDEVRLARIRLHYGDMPASALTHQSETELAAWPDSVWDHVLDCSGSTDEERAHVRTMMLSL